MRDKHILRRLTRQKGFPLFVIVVVMMIFTMVQSSGILRGEATFHEMMTTGFMSKTNWQTNFYGLVIQMFMMIGLTCILISGNFDMSQGAQATLGAQVFALILGKTNLAVGILTFIVISCIFGLVNAFLVNNVKLPAFIATMGISSVYGGLCNVLTGGNNIQIANPAVLAFGAKCLGAVPVMFLIGLIVLVVFEWILFFTRWGRSLYMAGGNPMAARLVGLNPEKLRTILFLTCSTLTVFGGICWSAQTGLASPSSIISSAPNMTAISAAILGGVSFMGGAGELIGPFIALFLVNVFKNMLQVMNVNPYWVVVAQGILLIVALVIDFVGVQRKKNAMIAAAMEKK